MPPKLAPLNVMGGAHTESIWCCAWGGTAANSLLVTGGADAVVGVWELGQDGALRIKHKLTSQGLQLGVVAVAASPSGLVAASSMHSRITVFDGDAEVLQLNPNAGEVWGIAFEPGDAPRHLAAASGAAGGVAMYRVNAGDGDQQTPACVYSLPKVADDADSSRRFTQSVAFGGGGSRIAVGAMDGTVGVFDTATQAMLHSLEGLSKPVRSLAFLPDGVTLAVACDDGHVALFDAENGALLADLQAHSSWAIAVAAHPGGGSFVTGGADGTVKLWELATRSCAQTLSEHKEAVWGVCYEPGGGRLATAGDDRSVALYDVSP